MVLIMSRKKVFLLLISLVFMSLFSNLVSAAEESFLPEIIEKFAKFLFLDLSAMSKSAPDTFVIYSKFIFFILVFSIFYWGASKAFGENKRIGGTIAFIFAIIGTVMLPKSLMVFIFETYAQVIGFVFGLLPFIIGLIISHTIFRGDDTWQRVLRGAVYVLMAVFTFALVGTLRGFEDTLYIELAKWAEVGAFIVLIVGIVVLIGTIGGGGGVGAGGWLGDRARGAWDRLRGGRGAGGGARTAEQEARIIRQMTEAVTRMEANYAIMLGIVNAIPPVAGAPRIRLNHVITFAQQRAAGATHVVAAAAVGPALAGIPARIAYLNDPRILGRIQNVYEQWTADWERLHNNITNIARLNAALRARVIAQLSNPI